MATTIVINKLAKRAYGQEYEAEFYRNGAKVYKLICFAEDLRYIRHAYTKDFEKAQVIKSWLKAKKTKTVRAKKPKK